MSLSPIQATSRDAHARSSAPLSRAGWRGVLDRREGVAPEVASALRATLLSHGGSHRDHKLNRAGRSVPYDDSRERKEHSWTFVSGSSIR
jgi:hypothetical protein